MELTYTSNAIEENALSRAETALIVEKVLTIGGKSITEHLEASNHAAAVDRSLNIYLQVIESKSEEPENEKLLKIDELAKTTNQTVPTISHWTKEGLLHVA